MEFLRIDNSNRDYNITPLEVLCAASFYKGLVSGQIEREIPITFIIMADDLNKTFELISMDSYSEVVLEELDESMNKKFWRPIAVEFCENDEDFTMIDLHYFPDPSDEDIDLINSMFDE